MVLHISLSSAKPPSPLDAGSFFRSSSPAFLPSRPRHPGPGKLHDARRPTLPGAARRPHPKARPTTPSYFLLEVRLDPPHAARLVDHGPVPDAPEAMEFCQGFAFRFRIYHNREATLLQCVLEKHPPALRGDAPTPRDQEVARAALALDIHAAPPTRQSTILRLPRCSARRTPREGPSLGPWTRLLPALADTPWSQLQRADSARSVA
ncbi:hypothetical protein AURDEDRAFT_172514 [Auricularia subglabra TFB-10046 SS5]|nr:hypothetical protein AURDEDRAFT_172514 [Auricularia subglabra TFB-10046 SS5]